MSCAPLIVAAALALAPVLPAHAWDFGETGSGVEKTQTRNVGNFSEIRASGATVLEVTAGQSATAVVVSGDDNIVPLVTTMVSGGVLRISMDGVRHTKLPVTVKIALPKLTGIDASGATRINVANLSGERFELNGSGSTKATIGGTVDKLVIKLSGAGRVDASGLATKDADVTGSGASNVEVNASDNLSVKISGAGRVTYAGHPTITKSISGAGKVAAR